jgi:predicted Rossmann fold flavoprotein
MKNQKHVAVIGGGAAGFFAAITCAEKFPDVQVTIYEKSNKLLSKVKISGGGRCNVTHACFNNRELVKNYPRGEKQLMNAFARFTTTDVIQWFESRNVKLKTEDDGRMFPVTDRSQTIVDCLMNEAQRLHVAIECNAELMNLKKNAAGKFELTFRNNIHIADRVIVAAGGYPKQESFSWLRETGHHIVSPFPSLFTFNIPGNAVTSLMGVSVQEAEVSISNTNFTSTGPLLITHWGMSGPAVLKLSSMSARVLAEKNYHCSIRVNWIPGMYADEMVEEINRVKTEWKTKPVSVSPFQIPKRLWFHLLEKSSIKESLRWADVSKEQMKKIVQHLSGDEYNVKGKTTFKEEFVTCGGVALDEVDFRSMESKKCKGLFFAGEVLDIDAFTGGFNFQAAWTTGYIAGDHNGL